MLAKNKQISFKTHL